MDIISGCWTGSTTAGSRSGWIGWRSNPVRPSGSRFQPNMPDAGCSRPSRRTGRRPASCGGTVSSEETGMSTATATIRSIKARAVVAPISRPVKNAFGVIEAAPLVLIDVATDQGVTGRSYIFAYAKLTLAPLVHLIEQTGGDLTGKAVALRRTIQTVGWVERSDTHHLYPSA